MRTTSFLAILLPLALAGCMSDPMDGDHLPSLSELDTTNGLYHLELEPSPNPPTAGDASLHLTVTDNASQAPVTGATISLDMMMPEHDHGMSEPPAVEEMGDGVYMATWSYPMTGYWEMGITIDGTAGKDNAMVGYEVQ